MPPSSDAIVLKIAVLGPPSVGKTSIIERLVDGVFEEGTQYPTIEDTYETLFESTSADGSVHQVTVQVLDTAGSEPHPGMKRSYIRRAHGFLLVYSIASEESFRGVRELRKEIEELKGKDIPIYVIGNKTDLEGRRQVDVKDAETWACMHKFGFCEVSVKTNETIKDPFEELLRKMSMEGEKESGKHRRKTSVDVSSLRRGTSRNRSTGSGSVRFKNAGRGLSLNVRHAPNRSNTGTDRRSASFRHSISSSSSGAEAVAAAVTGEQHGDGPGASSSAAAGAGGSHIPAELVVDEV